MNRFSEPLEPSIWKPPARDSLFAPGAVAMTLVQSRPLGMRSMTSFEIVAAAAFCLTSMSGDSAEMVTGLGDPADRHRQVDLQHLPQRQLHFREPLVREPLQLRRHLIRAGRQRRKPIAAIRHR